MSKKIIAASVCILGALAVGSPYVAGKLAEKNIYRYVDNFNRENNNSPYQFKVLNYNRGWFTSTASYALMIDNKPQVMHELQLYHGPIIVVDGITVGQAYFKDKISLNADLKEFMGIFISKQSTPVKADTEGKLTLFGKLIMDTHVLPFDFTLENGKLNVSSGGADLTILYNKSGDKFKFNSSIEGLKMIGQSNPANFNLNVGKIKCNGSYYKDPMGLWVGEGDTSLASLTWQEVDKKKSVSLSEAETSFDSEIHDKLFSFSQEFSLKSLQVYDSDKQVNLKIAPAISKVSVENINAEAMLKIKNLFNDMDPGRSETEQQIQMMSMLPLFVEMLDKGFKANIEELSIGVPEGMIDVEGSLQINPDKSPLTMITILPRVESQIQFIIPGKLLETWITRFESDIAARKQLEAQAGTPMSPEGAQPQPVAKPAQTPVLPRYEAKGYIVKSGDRYQIKIAYKGLHWYINDKHITFEALMNLPAM